MMTGPGWGRWLLNNRTGSLQGSPMYDLYDVEPYV